MKTSTALLSACPAATEITTVNGDYAAGNYFETVSENKLGFSQDAQFQNDNQIGENRYWGSKYNESGETIVSTDESNTSASNPSYQSSYPFYTVHVGDGVWVENNSRTAIPRSYNVGKLSSLFNWYAATADSGRWSNESFANDSVCPSGWQLPIMSYGEKSYQSLLFTHYDVVNGGASAQLRKVFSIPVSLSSHGTVLVFYNPGASRNNSREAFYWTKQSKEPGRAYNLQGTAGQSIYVDGYNYKSSGLSVRCVIKNSEP